MCKQRVGLSLWQTRVRLFSSLSGFSQKFVDPISEAVADCFKSRIWRESGEQNFILAKTIPFWKPAGYTMWEQRGSLCLNRNRRWICNRLLNAAALIFCTMRQKTRPRTSTSNPNQPAIPSLTVRSKACGKWHNSPLIWVIAWSLISNTYPF